MELVISVQNMSKIYPLYDRPSDRMKEALHPFRRKYHRDFYALQNINMEIEKGENVGIIGKNGAGKSTLLKIITGVLTPTTGTVVVNGSISSLLELGTGFNPEFTGIENIYFYGTVNGYKKEQMSEKVDDILAFADIGDFVKQPIKTYSTGMLVRLAFSVSTMIDPQILIIDEALSVGDVFFQAKCMTKMKKMIENDGTTLLLVSHDTASVKSLCNRGFLLEKGQFVYSGTASVAVEKYFSMKIETEQSVVKPTETETLVNQEKKSHDDNNKLFSTNDKFEKRASFQRIQNGKAFFKNVILLDENENAVEKVSYGQKLILRMAIEVEDDIHQLSHGYIIRDRNGVEVVYSDSIIEGRENLYDLKKGDKYVIDWTFEARLRSSLYSIVCAISIPVNYEIGVVDFCDYVPIATQFIMEPRPQGQLYGFVKWDNNIDVRKV
jgi:lipopolysaccharide transport system ATP-binding protein